MNLKKLKSYCLLTAVCSLTAFSLSLSSCSGSHDYESVEGDPMQTRIYTLDNGLKVYLTVNHDEPRIQTYIAVRTGSRNDPAESTGLAHYLEHLMFKGTDSFGTIDYAQERPLLDSIEAQYEIYGKTKDEAQRRAIYHRIDSFSYEASKFAIANEYDKLMAGIGSTGSNAFTSEDVTCYTENIPAGAVEQWAKVQADRFRNMVIRGFHTELEAVYEEYNIYLTNDGDKVSQAINGILFPHHPYGTQTTIGTQEHLKNPSLINVKNYYHDWYVPNNIAICMSGDLDPEETMSTIRRYFGDWQKSDSLPQLSFQKEEPLTQPVCKEVIGREAEQVYMAWLFAGKEGQGASNSSDLLEVMGEVLSNGMAGLMDLDLNKAQKVLESGAFAMENNDYSALWLYGTPKEGQTLEEVRQLMLAEVEKLKKGEWDESLLSAVVNNMKRKRLESLQDNQSRAMMFVESFIYSLDWADVVGQNDRIGKLTKQDIVDFANATLTDGYACVFKRQGFDPNEKKIEKPEISPIETNRDKTSDFVTEVLSMPAKEIAPQFLDFEKDLKTLSEEDSGQELISRIDPNAQLFSVSFIFDRGTKADKVLSIAPQYLDYMGTDSLSAEQYRMELYKIACDVDMWAQEDRTYVIVKGLAENMEKALQLCQDWLSGSVENQDVYDAVVADVLKARADNKLDQRTCSRALFNYGFFGPDNAFTHILSAGELQALKPADLLLHIHGLASVPQHVLYYGPEAPSLLPLWGSASDRRGSENEVLPQGGSGEGAYFHHLPVLEPEVIIAPFDAKNIYMRNVSNRGDLFDASLLPDIQVFNEYFGGGMNTIVFQELREARGLAYSAGALYAKPDKADDSNVFFTNIITQNDKMTECLNVFDDIVENMPQSEKAFQLAKDAVLKRLASERILREDILYYYMRMRDLGIDHDANRDIYEKVKDMTMGDLADFHEKQIKGRTYRYMILGDEKELDMQKLQQLGPIRRVTLEDIFGY
ncbi:MAG: insulinase family protein [Bacteroidaceae bacterium]|nr:insulinase family protein [Bacteroidaceae bacterium]